MFAQFEVFYRSLLNLIHRLFPSADADSDYNQNAAETTIDAEPSAESPAPQPVTTSPDSAPLPETHTVFTNDDPYWYWTGLEWIPRENLSPDPQPEPAIQPEPKPEPEPFTNDDPYWYWTGSEWIPRENLSPANQDTPDQNPATHPSSAMPAADNHLNAQADSGYTDKRSSAEESTAMKFESNLPEHHDDAINEDELSDDELLDLIMRVNASLPEDEDEDEDNQPVSVDEPPLGAADLEAIIDHQADQQPDQSALEPEPNAPDRIDSEPDDSENDEPFITDVLGEFMADVNPPMAQELSGLARELRFTVDDEDDAAASEPDATEPGDESEEPELVRPRFRELMANWTADSPPKNEAPGNDDPDKDQPESAEKPDDAEPDDAEDDEPFITDALDEFIAEVKPPMAKQLSGMARELRFTVDDEDDDDFDDDRDDFDDDDDFDDELFRPARPAKPAKPAGLARPRYGNQGHVPQPPHPSPAPQPDDDEPDDEPFITDALDAFMAEVKPPMAKELSGMARELRFTVDDEDDNNEADADVDDIEYVSDDELMDAVDFEDAFIDLDDLDAEAVEDESLDDEADSEDSDTDQVEDDEASEDESAPVSATDPAAEKAESAISASAEEVPASEADTIPDNQPAPDTSTAESSDSDAETESAAPEKIAEAPADQPEPETPADSTAETEAASQPDQAAKTIMPFGDQVEDKPEFEPGIQPADVPTDNAPFAVTPFGQTPPPTRTPDQPDTLITTPPGALNHIKQEPDQVGEVTYQYRIAAVLPPEIETMLRDVREAADLPAPEPGFFAFQSGFKIEDPDPVIQAVREWVQQQLPLDLELERVDALTLGSQRYVAGWLLQPSESFITMLDALRQALATHINWTTDAGMPARAWLITGDYVDAAAFPLLVREMQRRFTFMEWNLNAVEILRAPEHDNRWEVLEKITAE